MLEGVKDLSNLRSKGLNTNPNFFSLEDGQTPNIMNVKINHDGSKEKRLGSSTRNTLIIANSAASGFSPNTVGLTSGLFAFWNMNEATGTRFDSIGTNHLLDVGGVMQSGGIKNQAALFSKTASSYLTIPTNTQLETGDINFFVSTWVFFNSTDTYSIIRKGDFEASAPFTADTNTLILTHLDGSEGGQSFNDSSFYINVMNSFGGVSTVQTRRRHGNASGSFDGSDDYLLVQSNDAFNFNAGDFTIEANIYYTNSSGDKAIFGFGGPNDFFEVRINDGTNSTNALSWLVNTGGATAFQRSTNSNNLLINKWYHVAMERSSTTYRLYIAGSILDTITTSFVVPNWTGTGVTIGRRGEFIADDFFPGNIDEFRISNIPRYNGNFVPPGDPRNIEYGIGINSARQAFFYVSSSGTQSDGSVTATSMGALNTATWYNIVGWHDTANNIGISVNMNANSAAYATGLTARSANLFVGSQSNGASEVMDGRIDETGFWKFLITASTRSELFNSGAGNTFQTSFGTDPWASFDFGATNIRWLTVAAGTGIFASSNLGVTWVTIATDRTATYQYLDRSKNGLVATSDAYNNPLFWTGSANTFMTILNPSAPLAKYSINFQGFLILLNTQARKRGFFYEDDNTQLTGAWANSFDIPSSDDDEVTGGFTLKNRLYISTRYFLYRITFLGSNPVWKVDPVKTWGFVSRTVDKVNLKDIGEVAIGFDWSRNVRIFDGEDRIISEDIDQDNKLCDFAMTKISYAGSGPVISFGRTDLNDQTYKLCVAVGEDSTQTTHFINYNGLNQAFFPDTAPAFNTMTMAESGNRKYMMAFDRSGRCHMLGSGNLDGNTSPVDEVYDSNFIFEKAPSEYHKGHRTDLFFQNRTSGIVFYKDRTDYKNDFITREQFVINGSDRSFQFNKSVDVPESYNVYQYRITSSSGTNTPWLLIREDHFTEGQGVGGIK